MTADETQDTRQFRHYSTKSRIIAWLSQNIFSHITYTSRHGLTKGMKRKGGLGWLPAMSEAATPEENFWRELDLTNLVVYDVGAFHGLLTLYFSRAAKHVVSYEPNADNRQRLLDNVRLNRLSNVTIRAVGLAAESGAATMASSALMPGGSTVDRRAVAQLKQQDVGAVLQQIQLTTLDEDIAQSQLPPPDFIKIDVEGLELDVLRGAVRTLQSYRPTLFLEMHGNTKAEKLTKVKEIVQFLDAAGYAAIRHIETGTSITPDNSSVAAQGHLYCKGGAETLTQA